VKSRKIDRERQARPLSRVQKDDASFRDARASYPSASLPPALLHRSGRQNGARGACVINGLAYAKDACKSARGDASNDAGGVTDSHPVRRGARRLRRREWERGGLWRLLLVQGDLEAAILASRSRPWYA
jgi:hypothetical protein